MSSRQVDPVDEANMADAAEQDAPVTRGPDHASEPRAVPLEASEADAADQAFEIPDDEDYDY